MPVGPYEVPLPSPTSLRLLSFPLGWLPSNGTLLASLGDGVLATADGAMGLQKVLAGLDDLKLLDSWFFRQTQFRMDSLEKSKHFNLAFTALRTLPSRHLPFTHPVLWP